MVKDDTNENEQADTENKTVDKPPPSVVDHDLVEKAYLKIEEIVQKHIVSALEEVGMYLLEHFYDNDPENVRKNKPTQKESLLELINKIKNENEASPSKSWFYDSVKIAADKTEFEKLEYDQYNHEKVTPSHKVLLSRLRDIETKKTLIEKIINENMSVRDLKEDVELASQTEKQDRFDIYHLPSAKMLQDKSKKYLEKKIEVIEKRIETRSNRLSELEKEIKQYEKNKKTIQSAIQKIK